MGSTTRNELVYAKEVPGKGRGLFASGLIPKGTVVGMFDGIAKQINVDEALQCDRDYWVEVCVVDDVLFYFDMVDDCVEGVELINHACAPNCILTKFMVIKAERDIQPDEELTLDYFEITQLPLGIQCQCVPGCETRI